jgi:hypothetical protein
MTETHHQHHVNGLDRGVLRIAAAAILLVVLPGLAAAADRPPDRIELLCTEQPFNHVVFGDDGQITYEQQPPKEQDPVSVALIRDKGTKGQAVYGARIESPTPYLQADQATWTPGHQVDAQQGRLRIDLNTKVLTVSETQTPGQASFRRFQCKDVGEAAD